MTTLEEPQDLDRPNGGRSLTLDIDGPVHVVDYGGEGPPMLLVHGLGGSHLNWVLVAPPLARHFHVVTVDLPGFGLTPPSGRSIDVRAQARLVCRIVDEYFGEPAIIAGNSMGGLVALLAATSAPEHFDGIVLIDPAIPPDKVRKPSADAIRYLGLPLVPILGPISLERRRSAVPLEVFVRRRLDFVTADPSRIPEVVHESGYAMERARRTMDWSIQSFVDAARSITRVLANRRAFRRMIHSLGPPVLLLHGTQDEVVPVEFAMALAAERPDWDVEIIDDIGHVPQLECPHHVVDLIVDWHARRVTSPLQG